MKNMSIRNAIWRSRAISIIGFLIILLVIFNGLPGTLKNTIFIVFGLLTLSFGLAGSRHKSYAEPEKVVEQTAEDPLATEQIFPVVEEDPIGVEIPVQSHQEEE